MARSRTPRSPTPRRCRGSTRSCRRWRPPAPGRPAPGSPRPGEDSAPARTRPALPRRRRQIGGRELGADEPRVLIAEAGEVARRLEQRARERGQDAETRALLLAHLAREPALDLLHVVHAE